MFLLSNLNMGMSRMIDFVERIHLYELARFLGLQIGL